VTTGAGRSRYASAGLNGSTSSVTCAKASTCAHGQAETPESLSNSKLEPVHKIYELPFYQRYIWGKWAH
jgi:hypothetical protein